MDELCLNQPRPRFSISSCLLLARTTRYRNRWDATLRVFIEYYSSDKRYRKRYARYVTGIQVTTRMMLVVGMLLRYSVRYSSPRFLCLLLAVNGYGKRKATVILQHNVVLYGYTAGQEGNVDKSNMTRQVFPSDFCDKYLCIHIKEEGIYLQAFEIPPFGKNSQLIP